MDDPPKLRSPWKLVGAIVGVCFGGAIGFLAIPDFAVFTIPNTTAPEDSLDLAVVVVLLSILTFINGVARRLRTSRPGENSQHHRPPLRRPATKVGSVFLRYQLVLLFALFIFLNEQSWTAATVGFAQHFSSVHIISGVVAYGVLIVILDSLFRIRGIAAEQADNTMTVMAALWPRERRQKLSMIIAVCVINPVTEELLFRGILVYQLSLAIGNYELPLCFGLTVSLWNHAYQGPRSLLLHTLYYAFAVGLLFSPAGMVGAISMHYAGDIVPVALIKTNLKRYRRRHRNRAKHSDENLVIPQVEAY